MIKKGTARRPSLRLSKKWLDHFFEKDCTQDEDPLFQMLGRSEFALRNSRPPAEIYAPLARLAFARGRRLTSISQPQSCQCWQGHHQASAHPCRRSHSGQRRNGDPLFQMLGRSEFALRNSRPPAEIYAPLARLAFARGRRLTSISQPQSCQCWQGHHQASAHPCRRPWRCRAFRRPCRRRWR